MSDRTPHDSSEYVSRQDRATQALGRSRSSQHERGSEGNGCQRDDECSEAQHPFSISFAHGSDEPCGGDDPECTARNHCDDRGPRYGIDAHDSSLAPGQFTLPRVTPT
ncbi:hypothetical protein [Microbacterium rhizophilus]|uniref:hypothetical protein n=1 Tax=Microbacterium rhizophilus TaxID=3138934 RepID=UPI0031EA1624